VKADRVSCSHSWAVLAALAILAPSMKGAAGVVIPDAGMGQATLLGKPCRARQVLGGAVVRDRKSGRELFAVTNMNEVTGTELILIDFDRDRSEIYRAPAGAGSWNVREVSGDRLVIGTFYDGTFLIFDLKSKRFINHVRFAKEEYLWNTAMGGDGRVYSGTYPGGRLGALDLATCTVEDCGAPAAPNLYLRYVSPTHDGRVLCSFSSEKPVEKLYDPRTRTWADVPESIKGVSMGGVWDGRFIAGKRLFDGPDFTPHAPAFPVPPADKGDWYMDVTLTSDRWLVLRQGNAVYGWRKGDATLTKLADVDLRGGRYMAITEGGRLLGIRGQDYFVCKPGDTSLDLRAIPGDSDPRNLLFLRVDERGRIWSGAPFGQTLCYLDPRTRKAVNTRTVCDGGGEVYDVACRGGRVYAAAYSGGDIVEYTPDQPWDQWNNKNPRALATVSPGYIRPVAGIGFGPDGKLYSGWMARYGTYGGAVAITDPVSGKTELIENPLGEQAVEGLAVDPRPDARAAYVGTSLSANGLPGKRGESPRFGVLDLATRKAVFTRTFEGASGVRSIVFDPVTSLVALAVDGRLHLFDPAVREVVVLSADIPKVSGSIAVGAGGKLLYGSGKSVIEFRIAERTWRRLAEAPAPVGNTAMSSKGDLYVSAGPAVYRVKGAR
jgi:streptogramin lyase